MNVREGIKKIKKEFGKSFIFGIKLLFLIFLLIAPISLGAILGGGLYYIAEKIPLLSYQELRVITIQNYPFDETDPLDIRNKNKKESINILKRKSGEEKIYVKTNRRVLNEQERNELINGINEAFRDENTKEIAIGEKKYELEIADWRKTVKYGGLNSFGGFFFGICIFVIVIISLALYFPIVKAIINLFRRKRIFINE